MEESARLRTSLAQAIAIKAASSGLRKTCSAQDCTMRTLAIGDIHGCSTALRTLLDAVQPRAEDLLVTLGDYIDRGPDSRGVIETLLDLETRTSLIPLTGNHEILLFDAIAGLIGTASWEGIGGLQTLHSYGSTCLKRDLIPDSHMDFFKRCRRLHETATHIFVHANLNAMLPLDEQSDDWLFWTRFTKAYPHVSGKTMVCGHTAQNNGLPARMPHALCIDTGVYHPEGWLTCLDVGAGTFTQANERGQLRRGSLDDLV
jgi:serine/threonine protein phosphatase 1